MLPKPKFLRKLNGNVAKTKFLIKIMFQSKLILLKLNTNVADIKTFYLNARKTNFIFEL